MGNKLNKETKWISACLIGVGKHSQTKLIPALKKAGIKLDGIVTNNVNLKYSGTITYNNIENAISELPSTTLYILATPPNMHYAQAKVLLNSKRNVFVEKPACLTFEESEELLTLADKNEVIFVEMLMYLENKSVQKYLSYLENKKDKIKKIECNFLIPSIPANTFRTETNLGNSLLSDIGCYPLSFLAAANIDITNLSLVDKNKQLKSIFFIEGQSNDIDISINVGLHSSYLNNAIIKFKNDDKTTCEPFFYGRSGSRKIAFFKKNILSVERIFESDCFESMFLKAYPIGTEIK